MIDLGVGALVTSPAICSSRSSGQRGRYLEALLKPRNAVARGGGRAVADHAKPNPTCPEQLDHVARLPSAALKLFV